MLNAIERMTQLKTLRMSSCSRREGGSPCHYWIKSDTLEEINVTGMHKSAYFEEITCPSLKLFQCKGSVYGNGIGRADHYMRDCGDFSLEKIKSLFWMVFPGIAVSDTCTFRLQT
jgi:hypothetical protein